MAGSGVESLSSQKTSMILEATLKPRSTVCTGVRSSQDFNGFYPPVVGQVVAVRWFAFHPHATKLRKLIANGAVKVVKIEDEAAKFSHLPSSCKAFRSPQSHTKVRSFSSAEFPCLRARQRSFFGIKRWKR